MSKYSPIYRYIKKQKAIQKKLYKLQQKEARIRIKRKQLQRLFWGGDLDVDLYKDFFKNYCIELKHTYAENHIEYCQYIITDIVLATQSGPGPRKFWEAHYIIKRQDQDKNVLEQYADRMSLRKLLKLLMQPNASFRLR